MNHWRIALLLLLLAGCDPSPPQSEQEPTETVFDPMLQGLEKAEDAADVVEERKQKLDEALQQDGGP